MLAVLFGIKCKKKVLAKQNNAKKSASTIGKVTICDVRASFVPLGRLVPSTRWLPQQMNCGNLGTNDIKAVSKVCAGSRVGESKRKEC